MWRAFCSIHFIAGGHSAHSTSMWWAFCSLHVIVANILLTPNRKDTHGDREFAVLETVIPVDRRRTFGPFEQESIRHDNVL
jgi:hypothetical protein